MPSLGSMRPSALHAQVVLFHAAACHQPSKMLRLLALASVYLLKSPGAPDRGARRCGHLSSKQRHCTWASLHSTSRCPSSSTGQTRSAQLTDFSHHKFHRCMMQLYLEGGQERAPACGFLGSRSWMKAMGYHCAAQS